MARHKGAVGFEIGTSKLGAYSMEDTLEIFEREGYVKYKDLDQYFKDCYFDFENKLSEKEFIEKSKKNIMRSLKYREFINNEVKMCCICKKIKPLSSFYDNGEYGKRHECILCNHEYSKKWNQGNKDKKKKYNSDYWNRNKKELLKKRGQWARDNKAKYNMSKRRANLKKFLIEKGYDKDALIARKLNIMIELKDKHKIKKYETVLEKFGSVLNG